MPEHDDPIEELTRFGAGFSAGQGGGEMPLSAAEVRRRGDRIRHRRHAVLAGAAAAAVAAVTVPVLALGHGTTGGDDDLVAGDPGLSTANLLADADTESEPGRTGAYRTTDTFEGDGQAVVQVCQQQPLSALGATDSFHRTFQLVPVVVPGETPPTPPVDGLVESVAQFDSPATAQAAYDTVGRWVRDCTRPVTGATGVRVVPPRDATVPADSEASIYDIHWTNPDGEPTIGEIGLVLQRERIAIVTVQSYGATDYDYLPEDGGTPLDRMLPKAADRLRPESSTASPSSPAPSASAADPATPAGADPAAATIPDDFPLAEGWPRLDGDGRSQGPARDLDAVVIAPCTSEIAGVPSAADRLNATWQEPEDFRARQLSTFASTGQAQQAADAIVAAYRGCPRSPADAAGHVRHHSVRTGTLGEESWVLGTWTTSGPEGTPVPGLEVLYVVRAGNALLLLSHANEGGAADPGGDIVTSAEQLAEDAAPVVTALCRLADGACG